MDPPGDEVVGVKDAVDIEFKNGVIILWVKKWLFGNLLKLLYLLEDGLTTDGVVILWVNKLLFGYLLILLEPFRVKVVGVKDAL